MSLEFENKINLSFFINGESLKWGVKLNPEIESMSKANIFYIFKNNEWKSDNYNKDSNRSERKHITRKKETYHPKSSSTLSMNFDYQIYKYRERIQCHKIVNLLLNTKNQLSKFRAKDRGVEVNDKSCAT